MNARISYLARGLRSLLVVLAFAVPQKVISGGSAFGSVSFDSRKPNPEVPLADASELGERLGDALSQHRDLSNFAVFMMDDQGREIKVTFSRPEQTGITVVSIEVIDDPTDPMSNLGPVATALVSLGIISVAQ